MRKRDRVTPKRPPPDHRGGGRKKAGTHYVYHAARISFARPFPVQIKKGGNLKETPHPPSHLEEATAAWFVSVVEEFELDAHHVRLLTLACESWDRCQQAREILAKEGLTFTDRLGTPRARPEVGIERDCRISFARLVRELGLDSAPEASRPPALRR